MSIFLQQFGLSTKPSERKQFFRILQAIRYGLEIEGCFVKEEPFENFDAVEDASIYCKDNLTSIEYVSTRLEYKNFNRDWPNIGKVIDKNKSCEFGSCGGHVHMSIPLHQFGLADYKFNETFILLWIRLFQDTMTDLFYKTRIGNTYAKPNDTFSALVDCDEDEDRYYFVAKCLNDGHEEGHLEFRAHPEVNISNKETYKEHLHYLAAIFAWITLQIKNDKVNDYISPSDRYISAFDRAVRNWPSGLLVLTKQLKDSTVNKLLEQQTPIMNEELVDKLLAKKANINYNDDSALRDAIGKDWNPELVNILINQKANIDVEPKDDFSPLLLALKVRNQQITTSLLEAKANTEIAYKTYTPLLYAAHKQLLFGVKTLLKYKANVNAVTHWNQTALHLAVQQDSPDHRLVRILLEHKINVGHTTNDGKTALDLAREKHGKHGKHGDIARTLHQYQEASLLKINKLWESTNKLIVRSAKTLIDTHLSEHSMIKKLSQALLHNKYEIDKILQLPYSEEYIRNHLALQIDKSKDRMNAELSDMFKTFVIYQRSHNPQFSSEYAKYIYSRLPKNQDHLREHYRELRMYVTSKRKLKHQEDTEDESPQGKRSRRRLEGGTYKSFVALHFS